MERAALQEHSGADPRSIVNRVALDIEYKPTFHFRRVAATSLNTQWELWRQLKMALLPRYAPWDPSMTKARLAVTAGLWKLQQAEAKLF